MTSISEVGVYAFVILSVILVAGFAVVLAGAASQRLCVNQGSILMNSTVREIIQPYSFSNWTTLAISWSNGTNSTYVGGGLPQGAIMSLFAQPNSNLTLHITADSPLPLQVYDENGKVGDFYGSWSYVYAEATTVDWSGVHTSGPFFRVGNPNEQLIMVEITITGFAVANGCG